MRQLFHIAVFWVVVVMAIRAAVCFPHSLIARIFFSQFGPVPIRGEAKYNYLLRCARFGGSWFMQAVFLFVVGWFALDWHALLADSLYFLVLWAVIIPALGGVALLASLWALARSLWVRRIGGARSTQATTTASQSRDGLQWVPKQPAASVGFLEVRANPRFTAPALGQVKSQWRSPVDT